MTRDNTTNDLKPSCSHLKVTYKTITEKMETSGWWSCDDCGCSFEPKNTRAEIPQPITDYKYRLGELKANIRTHIPDFDMATEIMGRLK